VDAAIVAAGSARGFVVVEAARAPRVLAARGRDGTAPPAPSRSALRTALTARAPRVWLDLAGDTPLAGVASIRRLGLRAVACAPWSADHTRRGALVLDWTDGAGVRARPPSIRLLDRLGTAVAACLRDPARAASPSASDPPGGDGGLVGSSAAFRRALAEADAAAGCALPVLIEGESGTGKEALARRIHDRGPRARGPFVAVNCAAIPDGLVEGELFGAVRGAYTGAARDRPGLIRAADGGTLFLDEIGDMPATLQAKLLRVVQDGRVRAVGADVEVPVDVRILAATHRRLAEETRTGRFRGDLYHRLAVLRVRAPPLRARVDDLAELVPALLARLHRRFGAPRTRATPCAVLRLAAHPWPGNVRELAAVLARAAVARAGGPIRAEDLVFDPAPEPAEANEPARTGPLEADMIRAALREAGGSIVGAARRIGWTRQKLYRRSRALGVATSGAAPPSSPE